MTRNNQIILVLVIFAIAFLSENIYGKSDANPKNQDSTFRIISVAPHFGLVLPHHEDMVYFVNDYSYGLDVNFSITKYNQEWYQYLNYPEVGFGCFITPLVIQKSMAKEFLCIAMYSPISFAPRNFL